MKKINLALIFGGTSGEHEVSLNSAKGVINSLNKEKYNIIPIAITKKGNWLIGAKGAEYLALNVRPGGQGNPLSLEESQSLVGLVANNSFQIMEGTELAQKIDLVLPIIHGPYGEDGKLQGLLEMFNLPYVFSGVLASALAMSKPKTKIIAQTIGVPILPDWQLSKDEKFDLAAIKEKLGATIVIKPAELGSSVGMSIAKNDDQLLAGLKTAFQYDDVVLLEKYQAGRELTCGVWGNQTVEALPIVEIIPKVAEFFDYQAKYAAGGSEEVCPAQIPDQIRDLVQEYSVRMFKAVGCADLARADFIWHEQSNQLFFLEINTIPGMTQTSLVPKEAQAIGLEFSDFLDKLIGFALTRNNILDRASD